jgi:hypothetical protein
MTKPNKIDTNTVGSSVVFLGGLPVMKGKHYDQITIVPDKPETLPPLDGEFYPVILHGKDTTCAVQYDAELNRWFDGRGHAIAAKSMHVWHRYHSKTEKK